MPPKTGHYNVEVAMRALALLAASAALFASVTLAQAVELRAGMLVEVGGKKCTLLNENGTSVVCPGEGPKCVSLCAVQVKGQSLCQSQKKEAVPCV